MTFKTTADPQVPQDRIRASLLWVLVAAALATLLNAVKPMTIDDTVYYLHARNLLEHSLRPYAGTVFWFQTPQPATEIVAPPVFL